VRPAILPLGLEDCGKVAELHLHHLRTSYRGKSGIKLLECYYAALVQSDGGCGYIANLEGKLVGYICGVWDGSAIRQRLVKKYFLKLAGWGFIQLLVNPGFVRHTWNKIVHSNAIIHEVITGVELRPIVVAPEARQQGIGTQLIRYLVEDARGRGFDWMFLFTEEDNDPARLMYQNYGFQLAGKYPYQGVHYLKYVLVFGHP